MPCVVPLIFVLPLHWLCHVWDRYARTPFHDTAQEAAAKGKPLLPKGRHQETPPALPSSQVMAGCYHPSGCQKSFLAEHRPPSVPTAVRHHRHLSADNPSDESLANHWRRHKWLHRICPCSSWIPFAPPENSPCCAAMPVFLLLISYILYFEITLVLVYQSEVISLGTYKTQQGYAE